jgi:hypothetical protein
MRYWYEVSRRPTATMHSKPSSLDTQQQQQLTVFRSAAEFAPELRFLPICFLCHVNSESLLTICVLFTFFQSWFVIIWCRRIRLSTYVTFSFFSSVLPSNTYIFHVSQRCLKVRFSTWVAVIICFHIKQWGFCPFRKQFCSKLMPASSNFMKIVKCEKQNGKIFDGSIYCGGLYTGILYSLVNHYTPCTFFCTLRFTSAVFTGHAIMFWRIARRRHKINIK